MIFLRSLIFQIVFYLNFLVFGLMLPVALVMPRAFAWAWAVAWMRSTLFLWRVTTGSSYEFRGMEHLPRGGCVLAAKHQSAWETIAFATAVYELAFVMKKELMSIPVFGWFAAKTRMVAIQRSDGAKVLEPLLAATGKAIKMGRKIVIFMEGTRVAAGTMRRYKAGAVHIAQAQNCPIVPVALNSGLFWPRNSFWRYQGHVVVEFLPPLQVNKDVKAILEELETVVENATNRLILEVAAGKAPPPTLNKALDELAKRGVDIGSVR